MWLSSRTLCCKSCTCDFHVLIAASNVLEKAQETSDDNFYRRRRYQFGIGEGTTDLPPANSFPLECNAAFLNGGKASGSFS